VSGSAAGAAGVASASSGAAPACDMCPPRVDVAGPASEAMKDNTRARMYETVMPFLIGEVITKHNFSDGHGLNGRSST
jgi:hypothetical protein